MGIIEIHGWTKEKEDKYWVSKALYGDYKQAIAICKAIRRHSECYHMCVTYKRGDWKDYSIETTMSVSELGSRGKHYRKVTYFWENGRISSHTYSDVVPVKSRRRVASWEVFKF